MASLFDESDELNSWIDHEEEDAFDKISVKSIAVGVEKSEESDEDLKLFERKKKDEQQMK
jgi:hypothetical protein